MKKNVGGLDRFFRFGVSILALALIFAFPDPFIQIVFGIVAIFGLLTSISGYCPLNEKFQMDTRSKSGNKPRN